MESIEMQQKIEDVLKLMSRVIESAIEDHFGDRDTIGFSLMFIEFGGADLGNVITNIDDTGLIYSLRETAKCLENGLIMPITSKNANHSKQTH